MTQPGTKDDSERMKPVLLSILKWCQWAEERYGSERVEAALYSALATSLERTPPKHRISVLTGLTVACGFKFEVTYGEGTPPKPTRGHLGPLRRRRA